MKRVYRSINELTKNSRFWLLASGITLSFLLAGFIQLYIPAGSLQNIRIEQAFGFMSLLFLYVALLASPLTKVFPSIPINKPYLHARRAIGVLAFYYAAIHAFITFFDQLNGFSGIAYYNNRYAVSLLLGVIGLAILAILTMTSLDLAVKVMKFSNWKRLQRLVYVAGIAILVHVMILGTDFNNVSILSIVTYVAVVVLLILQVLRVRLVIGQRRNSSHVQG